MFLAAQFDDVERLGTGDPQSLALTDGEVVDPAMLPDHLTRGGYKLTRCVGEGLVVFGEVGVDELLVVAPGDEAYLLGVRLLGEGESVVGGESAHVGLGHSAE